MAGLFGDGLFGDATFGGDPVVVIPDTPRLLRELPPLRQSIELITPSGRHFRWGEDEPNPAMIPSGLRHSSTMPGGFETCDVTLPRKPGVDYSDLDRLSTLRIRDVAGEIVGEYRLERAPRVSGDQMAISPSLVGWQAHLDDDKSASVIYADRDASRWGGIPSPRRVSLGTGFRLTDGSAEPGGGLLLGSIQLNGGAKPIAEAWYKAGAGCGIGKIVYTWTTTGGGVASVDPLWQSFFVTSLDNASLSGATASTNLLATVTTGSDTLTATNNPGYAHAYFLYNGTATSSSDVDRYMQITDLAVYGDHGLALAAISGDPDGILASTVVGHAVGQWAPLLNFTAGDTIQASDYPIPHLIFPEATTAAEIIRQATRFGLQDWAVWENKTFYWHTRNARGRSWRARISPAQLEETGPQVDRTWNSIMVMYQDVDGSTRTVGPTGSGADTEDTVLEDTDPDNPANQLGIIRRDLLQMGVGTAASATEVGRRFLEQAKLLDSSGRARLVGFVTDDRGIAHPYTSVRAGDQISFVDASDTSARRIVRADHDRASRSCSIDLDSPPEGLAALLERLNVVLVPLGL